MSNITETQAVANFASLKNILLASAPSQKAYDFAGRITAKIENKGAAWIAANALALHITSHHGTVEADADGVVPVADNRNWFMAELQIALANG